MVATIIKENDDSEREIVGEPRFLEGLPVIVGALDETELVFVVVAVCAGLEPLEGTGVGAVPGITYRKLIKF